MEYHFSLQVTGVTDVLSKRMYNRFLLFEMQSLTQTYIVGLRKSFLIQEKKYINWTPNADFY